MLTRSRLGAQNQRGLSVVEMLVGVAIGLVVVAGAALVVSSQLSENRKLLVETQVQQDLRASADIITRELRRAGYWNLAPRGVWYRGTAGVLNNSFIVVSPAVLPATEVTYQYRRTGSDTSFGFKLEEGAIKTLVGNGWQSLTDRNALKVTGFTITPQSFPATPAKLPCPKLCADGTDACWPTLNVRELVVDIAGEAATDPSVKRSIRSTVRLRNDVVKFNDLANPTRICPV